MAKLRLARLGGFEARLDSGPRVAFPRRKALALLAYLALGAGQTQPRDKLAALLWGDVPDRQARQSLRQALVTLRALLAQRTPARRASRRRPISTGAISSPGTRGSDRSWTNSSVRTASPAW